MNASFKRIPPAAAALGILLFSGTYALGETDAREVISAWRAGTRGVVETYPLKDVTAGREFPVVRNGEITGIFTVYYAGVYHAWGEFTGREPELSLDPGDDVVIFPAEPPSAVKRETTKEPVRARYCIPAGYTMRCLINAGTEDGLKSGDAAAAYLGKKPAGAFELIQAGKRVSHGLLNRTEKEEVSFEDFIFLFGVPGAAGE
ncbi:MAG: hypothetical protein AB1742_14595 [bacterium]